MTHEHSWEAFQVEKTVNEKYKVKIPLSFKNHKKKIKPRDADRGRKTDIQATVYELSVFYLGMHVYMFIYTITINESRGYEVEGEQGEVYGRERY